MTVKDAKLWSRRLVPVATMLAVAWLLRPPRREDPLDGLLAGLDPQPVVGFGTVERAVAGRTLPLLLAVTGEQIAQGLAGRTDLAGHAGMLFVFPCDVDVPFHMRNTPMPLDLVWLDRDGTVLSVDGLAPGGPSDQRLYPPPGPYRAALEMPRGTATPAGLAPGAVVDLSGLVA